MKCGSNIRITDPDAPDPAIIDEAAAVIRSGGVVALPTTALYGLAADAFNCTALEKVYRMKNRPRENPLLLFIESQADAIALTETVPRLAQRLMERCWPGTVTLVMKAKKDLPSRLVSEAGNIGLRMPAHPVVKSLIASLKSPITGTSANISGQPGISRGEMINRKLMSAPDLVLDAGPLKGGPGSTVVDVTVSPPRILREGVVSAEALSDLLDSD